MIMALLFFAQENTPVDPVNWRELTPFLVDIEGWEAGEPEGSTVSMQQFKISTAEREYVSGDKNMNIEIADGAYVSFYYQGIKMAMNFEIDTSEEYVKKITIQEFSGIEKYNYGNKEAEVILLLNDRFVLTLTGDNFENTEELKEVAALLDLSGIADLANK